ncbi:MAG: SH3 domain-containing protein [Desulfovibrionaceae bacterium]
MNRHACLRLVLWVVLACCASCVRPWAWPWQPAAPDAAPTGTVAGESRAEPAPQGVAAPAPQAVPGPGAPPVRDMAVLPQDLTRYVDPIRANLPLLAPATARREAARFETLFFSPWRRTASAYNATEIYWGVATLGNKTAWGENLRPRPAGWFEALVAAADQEHFPSQARPAITVRNTSLRVLPTHHPFFLDFSRAGEGYPFDYLQNSALWAGTPVFVSHASADGAWLLAETAHVWGWLPARDVAFADAAFMRAYANGRYVAVLRDGVALAGPKGRHVATAHVGALFPVERVFDDAYSVYVPLADAAGGAVLGVAHLARMDAAPFPMRLTEADVARVGNVLLGQAYGWGGLYENRDCSAMLRDLFTPFGLWLPRNSAQQAIAGDMIDVRGLEPPEREALLLAKGKPFRTLVGLRGHIMLYVGRRDGRAVVFHNTWGVKTVRPGGGPGRAVIGQAVVTGLQPGLELPDFDPEGDLRWRMEAITILPAGRLIP